MVSFSFYIRDIGDIQSVLVAINLQYIWPRQMIASSPQVFYKHCE